MSQVPTRGGLARLEACAGHHRSGRRGAGVRAAFTGPGSRLPVPGKLLNECSLTRALTGPSTVVTRRTPLTMRTLAGGWVYERDEPTPRHPSSPQGEAAAGRQRAAA